MVIISFQGEKSSSPGENQIHYYVYLHLILMKSINNIYESLSIKDFYMFDRSHL